MTYPSSSRAQVVVKGVGAIVSLAVLAVGVLWTHELPAQAAPGVMFGAHVEAPNGQTFVQGVAGIENRLGRKLAIVNKFHDWSMVNFSDEEKLMRSGHLVMVSWHPTDGAGDPNRANKIVRGDYDNVIRAAADAMKALHGDILLRWDFEMTQSPGQTENVGSPAEFVAAWRYMHDMFDARGATNVKWVWAPQSAGFTEGRAAAFYPGAAYVDWIEASDVMGGHSWPNFRKVFTPFYRFGTSHDKRLMVWVGLPERPSDPGWKAGWFSAMRSTIKQSMPRIKAVVYFHATTSAGNFHADTSSRSWDAFKSLARDDFFRTMP